MKVAIMQPYFFPYIGYFQLMSMVDIFVCYDDVNYINKGWINRNFLTINQKKNLFTIPLIDASQNKLINEIMIKDDVNWWNKFFKTLELNFKKLPFYNETMPLLESIVSSNEKNLAHFIFISLEKIIAHLDLKCRLMKSSQIENTFSHKGEERIISICKMLNADSYINPTNGKDLYSNEHFKKNNLELSFIKVDQNKWDNSIDPFLSLLELLLLFGKERVKLMLAHYELEKILR